MKNKRWKTEYLHGLLEHHQVNRGENACPEVGEIVPVVGGEKNRIEWRQAKVVELVRGKENVVRGVKILTKGHTIERPLLLVCSRERLKNQSRLKISPRSRTQKKLTTEHNEIVDKQQLMQGSRFASVLKMNKINGR